MASTWASDFPDASGNLVSLFAGWNFPPQNNLSFYKNPQVDELLTKSESEQDQEARLAMLVDAQKLIAEDAPVIFYEHFKWFYPMSSAFTGYTLGPLWYWDSFGRDLAPASK